jgi:hypothetical protein
VGFREKRFREKKEGWFGGWLAQKGDGGDYDSDEQQRSENVFVGGEPGLGLEC